MADGPSNFRSWQDELALNGEQEQQLLDRAMQEAQQTRQQAARAMNRGTDEARQAQLREARQGQGGGGTATTVLSATGSYQDYLKLKLKAEGQYQAAARGQQGVGGLLRRQLAQRSGVNDAWTEQGDMQEVRQQRALDASASGAAGATRLAGEEKARNEAKAQAEKDRLSREDGWNQDFNASIERAQKATDDRIFTHRDTTGVMAPERLNQMRLSQIQRTGGLDAQGKKFDPFSTKGREMRSSAYGGWQDGRNRFNPYGYQDRTRTPTRQMDAAEKKWGSYGGQK